MRHVGMTQEVEGELDVVSRNRDAVVPSNVGAQLDRPRTAVRRELPMSSEPSFQRPVRGYAGQRLEHDRGILVVRRLEDPLIAGEKNGERFGGLLPVVDPQMLHIPHGIASERAAEPSNPSPDDVCRGDGIEDSERHILLKDRP